MITIRRARTARDYQQAALLIGELQAWIRDHMAADIAAEQPAFRDELAALPEYYCGTTSAVFLAACNGRTVGCVAVRCHPDGHAELKRMFVRTEGRRAGVGGRLVEQVVQYATERDCRSVWLETARGAMDPAIAMYARHGFSIVADRAPDLQIDNIVLMRRLLARLADRDQRRSGAVPR